jgi:hypothetical protein
MMSDLALNKKDESKGVWKTYHIIHVIPEYRKAKRLYKDEVNYIDNEVYNRLMNIGKKMEN